MLHSKDGGRPKAGQTVYRTKGGRTTNQTVTLGMQAEKMWATPNARDYRSPDLPGSGNYERKKREGWTIDLNSQAAQWPTPTARDHKGAVNPESRDRMMGSLDEAAEWLWGSPEPSRQALQETGPESPGGSGLRLNPTFVEWLMGVPEGWTDSECSETAWSRWLRLMRSALSSSGW